MLPVKAYVLEAYYKWITDSGYSAYLVVDATIDHVDVPQDYIEDGHIVLNISPQSIRDLVFDPSFVAFRAQFSGMTYSIYIPILAVLSIYAKENPDAGKSFDFFDEDDDHPLMQPMPRPEADGGADDSVGGASHRPFLRILK
ncbi:MAG: ClpXP protease specificity-enhancing factor SspB [Gammaproteobacteria bacterium]|nr:ClpXP protease specificity-enhancing factor SspB [Gammaproteobacteria bacterium]MCD8542150.1 ClpXP protease specificity-enhancing factor SspB [Gammaproteobacteria bacterium]